MKKTSTKIKEAVTVKSVKIDLPKDIFEVPMNTNLVHQVVTTQSANRRQVIAHAKTRAEVSGGGIKPWKQKGTGRARHGSNRSPIWIGGGVTHGPLKDRIWKKRLPKNIKNKALFMVLSDKAKNGWLVIAEELKMTEPKTVQAKELLKNIGITESCLVALGKMDKNLILGMRNIPKTGTIQAKDLNCLDIVQYKYLLTDKEGVEIIKKTFLGE